MLFLPTFLSFLVAAASVGAEPSNAAGGSALYPPGLLPLINRANTLLSTGQFNDAIRAYSDAIEQSPADYILYYKRATAYLSLSRHQSALQDFDRVLDLTHQSFDKALLQKGRIHAKDGNWADAREMARGYAARAPQGDSDASDLLFAVSEGEMAARKAGQAQRAGLHTACVEAATDAIRTATHSTALRQQRADCALSAGDLQQTVGDLIRLTHLTAPSTSLLLRIARMSYYLLPPSTQALSTLKQCLHYDPDSKPCASAHRQLKQFDRAFKKLDDLREAGDWRGVVTHLLGKSPKASETEQEHPSGSGFARTFDDALDTAASEIGLPADAALSPKTMSERRREIVRGVCVAYVRLELPRRAERWCEELLAFTDSAEDVDGLVGRGEALLAKEEWENAVRSFERAFEASGRSNQDVHQRLQKAQRLLKQSRKKDYYKVLDVARDADERTIKKAYRRAAKLSHPDKGGSEARMAAVNEAYEVLSNPELRQRFDNGDDPNDPMAQQGGHPFQQGAGGHPFAQFFQQGGFPGGGFQFHFSGQH